MGARLWKTGGLVVVVVLAVGSWYLLISPKFAKADEVKAQTADTQTQLITLRKRIGELKKQQANLTGLQAELRKKQKALPSDSGLPAFLNQLQRSGTDTDVNVTGVTVGAPTQQANLNSVWALPMTLTADGSTANLERFLTSLQTGQARAVLIQSASVTSNSDTGAAAGPASANPSAAAMTISISLKAFVAQAADAGAPSVTRK